MLLPDLIIQILNQHDFCYIIPALLPPALLAPKINAIRINKDFHPKDVSKVIIPEKLKTEIKESKQIKKEIFKDATLEFTELMLKSFPPYVLDNFYRNIKDIKIMDSYKQSIMGPLGVYNCEKNRIKIFDYSALFHELFHMASSYYDKDEDIVYCGFSISINNEVIGNGINEGYTELLTQRYLGNKHNLKKTYFFEVKVATLLEKIVGTEQMEEYYLMASRTNLIEDLKMYTDEKKVINFLVKLDYINSNPFISLPNEIIRKKVVDIHIFLLETYYSKLKLDIEENRITVKNALNRFDDYYYSIGDFVNVNGFSYKLELSDLYENLFNGLKEKRRIK